MKIFIKNNLHHVTALLLWLAAFIVYLQTLAPSVGFIDSGELAAVPCVLGIAHPTGYPLWTLIGHIFSQLPIAKEEVVRLNIESALLTSLAAAAFYYVMLFLVGIEKKKEKSQKEKMRYGAIGDIIPALFGASALAFSHTFWDQSAHIEVYALHLFLVGVVMLFFLRAMYDENSTQHRQWFFFSYVLGLSFTNHLTTILLAPAFLFLYFRRFGFSKEAFRFVAILAIPFLLGLSAYLYFPIRAAQHPVLNWGNPTTLEKIFWHISGKQYRVWMFSSTDVMAKQFNYFLSEMPKEFYYFPLLFSLLGIWRLLWRNRTMFLFIFLLLAGCLLYTINYDIFEIDPYFLLAYIALALFAVYGAVEAMEWFQPKVDSALRDKKFSGKTVMAFLLLVIVIAEAGTNFKETDESHNYLVEDYTKNILTNLQPNAIILSYQWDYFVAGSFYFQFVKHARTDVTVIDKELLRRSWYYEQMKHNYPQVYERSHAEISAFLEELYKFEHNLPYDPAVIEARYNRMIDSFIDHNFVDHPVYVTMEIEPHLASHYLRVPEGLAYRLCKDTTYHPIAFPSLTYRPYPKTDRYTTQLHKMYAQMLVQRGMYEQRYGHNDLAEKYFEKAKEISPQFVMMN
jgi:hypothetical protein